MKDMRVISRGQVGLTRQLLSLDGKVLWFCAWDSITPMHCDLCVFPILPFLMWEFYHGYLVSALSLHVGFVNEWSREIGQVNTKSFLVYVRDLSTHIQCFFLVSDSPRYPLLPGIFHFCYVLVTKNTWQSSCWPFSSTLQWKCFSRVSSWFSFHSTLSLGNHGHLPFLRSQFHEDDPQTYFWFFSWAPSCILDCSVLWHKGVFLPNQTQIFIDLTDKL